MADLIPIPMGIPWDPLDPSISHSHAHLYLVVLYFMVEKIVKETIPRSHVLTERRRISKLSIFFSPRIYSTDD